MLDDTNRLLLESHALSQEKQSEVRKLTLDLQMLSMQLCSRERKVADQEAQMRGLDGIIADLHKAVRHWNANIQEFEAAMDRPELVLGEQGMQERLQEYAHSKGLVVVTQQQCEVRPPFRSVLLVLMAP